MSDTADREKVNAHDLSSPPSAEEVRGQLERILASRSFRSAHSQSRFLRYVVEETLAGRGNLVKEYLIGMEALGRGEAFDPRLDPIVRTQARKLRARLAKYYETESGPGDVRIEFHKGSYAPAFQWIGAAKPVVAESAEIAAAEPPQEKPAVAAFETATVAVAAGARPVWVWAVAAAAVLCAIAVGSFVLGTGWRPGATSAEPASIAVMPFVNLNESNAEEFLSDGISDELIDSLKQLPGLQVVARTSSFRFKGNTADVREISRQLHVRAVLVGSVRRTGDRLKITAQLESAQAGYHLWTGTFERDASEARAIPWEIASAVADVLGPAYLADGGKGLAKAFPRRAEPSPAAYQNYLKGLYFWNKLSADGLAAAIHYFQQAISEDPSFARAYAALAHCYVVAPQVTTAPSPEALAMIKAAASRALELDSSLGEAHFDLAVAAEYEFDWNKAEEEFRKGLELSPGSAVGHLWYAKFLAIQGRKDQVFVHRKIAADLDPVSPYAVQSLAGYFSVMGRYEEAVMQFKSALSLDPAFGLAHQGLGLAYLLQGKHEDAIEELRLANKWMVGPRRMALLGYAYAKCGRLTEANGILDDFLRRDKDGSFPAVAIALVYLGMEKNDQAFRWLEKAIDQRDLDVTLLWDTPFEPLRSDPRFVMLLRRMKLA